MIGIPINLKIIVQINPNFISFSLRKYKHCKKLYILVLQKLGRQGVVCIGPTLYVVDPALQVVDGVVVIWIHRPYDTVPNIHYIMVYTYYPFNLQKPVYILSHRTYVSLLRSLAHSHIHQHPIHIHTDAHTLTYNACQMLAQCHILTAVNSSIFFLASFSVVHCIM